MTRLSLFAACCLITLTIQAQTVYRFVVTEVPANTPHDATLYVAGTFNKWNPGDVRYKLRRQQDGTYRVMVYSDAPILNYKFTRGDWETVEGRESGKARPNRVVTQAETGNRDIDVSIQSWEDLTSTFQFYSLYDLLMLFSCFQGLLLLIAIPSIQNYNRSANRWLVALIGIASLFVLLKVVSSYRDVAQTYTKLLLVPDFIWFLYAPLFYFYVRRLLFDADTPARSRVYHFIPAVIQFFAYLPYFLMESKIFQLKVVNQDPFLRGTFMVMGLLALAFNAAYWLTCRRTIRAYKTQYQTNVSYEQNLQYLSTVLIIQAVCLTFWAFLYGLVLANQFIAFDVLTLAERNADAIWLAFSTITYFLGYVAIRQPEIFKLPRRSDNDLLTGSFADNVRPQSRLNPPPVIAAAPIAGTRATPPADGLPAGVGPRPMPGKTAPDWPQLRETVAEYMVRQKPYANPSLTIHELAGSLKIPPHVLSRVINDGFGKNFFDFVNEYRVDEFKRRMSNPRAKQHTLLSLAFEVGFNSKTAFNRAFKKLTNQTPKEYFHVASEEQPL